MRHRIGFNRLDRRSGQRKALLKNALTSLFIHERIKTTKAKALEIRRFAEKIVTKAKEDSVHNRRIIGKTITNKAVLTKIFTEIAPRYKERPGGYTRILKLGQRRGDAAEIVILELVESEAIEEKKQQKKKRNAAKQEKKRIEEEKAKEAEAAEAAEEEKAEEKADDTKTVKKADKAGKAKATEKAEKTEAAAKTDEADTAEEKKADAPGEPVEEKAEKAEETEE